MTEWKFDHSTSASRRAVADVAAYMAFFGIRRKPPVFDSARYEKARERIARIANPDPASLDKRERDRAKRAEQKQAREKRAAELAEVHEMARRSDWRLNGAFGASRYAGNVGGPVMLRVCETSLEECIETSLGARIPLAAAPMVWSLVQRARRSESGMATCRIGLSRGPMIGDYPLDRIDADGTLHAGCHTIGYAELELMARKLGLA